MSNVKQFFLFIALFLFIFKTSLSQNKKTEVFVDNYLKASFWNVQEMNQPLIKWSNDTKSIKYKIVGDLAYLNEKTWIKYLSEIEMLTGISMNQTTLDDFDILIFFGDLEEYAKMVNIQIGIQSALQMNNWSSRYWDKGYNLTKASFCIVPSKIKSAAEGTYRLKKGLLKSLGILGELDDDYSIFYKFPTPSNTRISRMDKKIIKLHYSNSIKAGSSIKAVRNILLTLPNIEDLSKEKL